MTEINDHFKDKTPIKHVIEAQANGIMAEIHGTEMPGLYYALIDASRETVIFLFLLSLVTGAIQLSFTQSCLVLMIAALGLLIWKSGRSAWLGWFRLERLHRTLEEERWEIEHNRLQEREELRALYTVKGFEGKLLEDVLDVLMADGDRLLKVMVEEELGLSLEVYEHPLRHAIYAGCGVLGAAFFCLVFYWIWPLAGLYSGGILVLGFCGYYSAFTEKNHIISAVTWNIALALLSLGSVKFLFDYVILRGWLP